MLPLRLYCLNIVCPLGLPGTAPGRMPGEIPQKPSLIPHTHIQSGPSPLLSAFPWSTPIPDQQSHVAWPLHYSSAPVCVLYLPRPVQHYLAMQPSGLQWRDLITSPAQRSLPGPGLLSADALAFSQLVFLHPWEANFLASVNPEEERSPSFPGGRMTPFSILSAKQKESTTVCFWSEGLSGSSQNGLRDHIGADYLRVRDQQAAAARSDRWWSVGLFTER